jgi:hypothetical protein
LESNMTNKVLRGVVHGNTIELREDTGLSDGAEVEVTLRPTANGDPGRGLASTEGALATDTEWDAIMDDLHSLRREERRPQWEGS